LKEIKNNLFPFELIYEEVMRMVIAGYAGIGKSALGKKYNIPEIPSMPYAWILPKKDPNLSYEAEKAAKYHVRNPLFPGNMLAAILMAEQKWGIVIIPTVISIIEVLQQQYGRNVVLCYPEDGLEEEYMVRYTERGNSESFIDLFVYNMSLFIKQLKNNGDATHIILKSGEYLTDHWGQLESLRLQEKTPPVPLEQIQAMEKVLIERSKNYYLVLMPLRKRKTVACFLSDLDNDDVKNFIYNMGRKLGSELCSLLMLFNNEEMIKELEEMGDLSIIDRDEFALEIEEWLAWNMGYFSIGCE